MGDSETVVAQSSTVMDYTTYPSTACVDANSNYAHSGDSSAAVPDAKDVMPQSYPVADTSSLMQEANLAADGTSQSFDKENAEQVAPEAHTVAMISDQPALNGTNTNGDISNDVNSTSAAGDNGATTEQPQTDGVVLSAEAERLWNIVKANSTDFNAWTSLIEETEKTAQDNIMSIRKVYDSFLVEFPLCYGYWKKYADHEARFGAIDKVVEVYERAVQGVTYSVEIWLHYCTFAIGTYGDPDTVRRLFERGLAYVGTDYLSYPLWDKYIEYEYTHQQWSRLAAIYTRIFENPNQQLDRYFASFKDLVGSQPLPELRTAEETSSLESNPGADGQRIEGEVNSEGGEELGQPINTGLTEADEKEKYIAIREEAYKKAKEFDSKIIGFETAIRRPYFHVRPLIDVELENWHTYLDFIEKEGDFNKIVKLYERCLVACANYPEYWIRYILCMEACGSMDIAENALARATQVFVKRQPEIHLFAARFKEQHGDVSAARTAYQLVHSEIAPGLLEAIIDHANMERRLGNMEGAFSLYEQAIAIEKGKEQSQMLPLLFAQYSRFVYLVCGNVEKAREILVEAIQKVQLSKPLLEALLHLESIQQAEKRIDYLDDMVEKFISPDPSNLNMAPLTEREESSRIYLEFLGLFGDAVAIKKAKDRHFKLFIHHRSSSESRKRDADDLSSDKAKLMKPYAGVTSAPSVVGSYPAATQTQWPTGYVPQAQTWPPVAQVPAQGQTWNPGYTQQAAAAYPGYYGTNYAQPQVPTSVPQASAYGAYAPPTYPAQAYPQQAYATPATAAAAAPVQQPAVGAAAAAAPQTYYGATYY